MAPADLVTTFDGHVAAVNALDLAEDGTLYSAGKDGRLKLWDLNTNEMLTEIEACQVGTPIVTSSRRIAFLALSGSFRSANVCPWWNPVCCEDRAGEQTKHP